MPNKREQLIELFTQVAVLGDYLDMGKVADYLIANGVRLEESKRIEELEAKLAEREEVVCNLRKKWDAAETHICTMCGHFDHKTDGNIVYGYRNCGELVGYPCCGKFTPWIPVAERLPDAGKVLCLTTKGHYKVMEWLETFKCWTDPGGIDFTNFKRGYVTHWMYLPEPPKGE